jgi:hypothetical protein
LEIWFGGLAAGRETCECGHVELVMFFTAMVSVTDLLAACQPSQDVWPLSFIGIFAGDL